MEGWKETTFGDFVTCNPTIKLKKGSFVENCEMEDINPAYKYLKPQAGKIYEGSNSKFINGDTVFARITPCLENCKVAQIKGLAGDCGIGSTEFFVFRGKGNVSDNDYVYYLSKTQYIIQSAVNSMSGASGRQRADLNFIKRLKIIVPPLPEQQRIASILSTYDELIETNNRRIALLEESARELYKEWFVRFRFPGYQHTKFIKGLPEGWKEVNLGDIADLKVGGDKPTDFVQEPTQEKNIPIYSNGESQKGLMGYTSLAKIKDNCITVSARGNVGYVCLRRHAFTPIVRLLAVIPKKDLMDEIYLYQFLLNSEFFSTGAAQQQITAPMLKQMKVTIPAHVIRQDFFDKCDKIYMLIESLENQSTALATARDRLLPRLISGKLRV